MQAKEYRSISELGAGAYRGQNKTEWSWGTVPGGSKFISGLKEPWPWSTRSYDEAADARIRLEVCDAVSTLVGVDADAIDVRVSRGAVKVRGVVSDVSKRHSCERIVGQIEGVTHVQIELRVPGLASGSK